MYLVFLTSLTVALSCVYVYKHASEDIAYLAAAIFWVSLFVSLLVAPWQLQLLLLMLVLLSKKRNLLPSEPLAKSQEENKIQLTYRGNKYEATPPSVEVSKDEITGKYRGQIWRVRA